MIFFSLVSIFNCLCHFDGKEERELNKDERCFFSVCVYIYPVFAIFQINTPSKLKSFELNLLRFDFGFSSSLFFFHCFMQAFEQILADFAIRNYIQEGNASFSFFLLFSFSFFHFSFSSCFFSLFFHLN